MHDSERIEHLIIRQVNNSDMYEWITVSQPKHKYCSSNDQPFKLWPEKGSVIEWTFTADSTSGGRRLSEICSVFAEQQIQKRESELKKVRDQVKQRDKEPAKAWEVQSDIRHLGLSLNGLLSLYGDLRGIIQRERDQQVPNEELKKQMEEQLRNSEAERSSMIAQREASRIREENLDNGRTEMQQELDECLSKEFSLRKQMEDQLRDSEAERSSMIAQIEALRVREENLKNQRAESQQLFDEIQEKHTRDSEVAEAQIAGIKRQMEEQLQKDEAERISMIAHLKAYRVREENHESRREEAQHRLEECQKAAIDSEQEFNRKEKETNHWIMMAALIGGAVMLLVIGIFIFVLCRKAGKRMIDTSEEMKRELGLQRERQFRDQPPNRPPGSVAIDVAEIDSRFGCSRDPQVAALRHSILADENGHFGFNQIDEVTEQEGIDVSAVTRQSTIGDAGEGELVIQAIKEGVKGAVERKQKRQMHVEPLRAIMQNAVVVQDEVIAEIVEVMETDKEQEPERPADQ